MYACTAGCRLVDRRSETFFPNKGIALCVCVCVCVRVCVSVCVSVCECVFIFFVSLLKMFVNQIYFIVKDSFSYSFLRNL